MQGAQHAKRSPAGDGPFVALMDDLASNELPKHYVRPPFPSLHPRLGNSEWDLRRLSDMWRFTLLWTLIMYALFHLGAASIALVMQIGKRRANWRYLWMVPLLYLAMAGVEALLAGSIVGLIVGAVYIAGHYPMSPWIPFFWGWINVLVLVVSSFSIQGGL
ncbi:hypothetical protein VTK73DRAFT_2079 [Phialemonium thermophilum]|uniref:Integral membrane protein n=1 Tax=Phialemonium thermophilum TaxID=223376 RepID=A0ABR3VSS2_9PEZI